jgi:hypothetical protein
MEYVREIIDSSLLDKINLPVGMKNKKVEIIIFPIKDDSIKEESLKIDDFVGALDKYKNQNLISSEKDAWAEAMVNKHGTG